MALVFLNKVHNSTIRQSPGFKHTIASSKGLFSLPDVWQNNSMVKLPPTNGTEHDTPVLTHDVDPGSFLFLMTRTARHWRRELDTVLAHYGLTEARTRPLIYIDRLGDGIRQKDLALELDIEGSSLVRLLDTLESADLIRRRVGKDDRRERHLYLRPAGRELVERVRDLTNKLHRFVLDNLTPAQEQISLAVFSTLDKVLENAGNIIDQSDAVTRDARTTKPTKKTPAKNRKNSVNRVTHTNP
jgi:MarR family transcriptional regulator for hemolysin